MKVNSKILTSFPKASYIVTRSGRVKSLGYDAVSRTRVSLNISKQQRQYALWDIIWAKGLGKQYV